MIFLFLRSLTATIIPAIALPISLIGTFGGMYLFGYSIDNLSLLALTLSVGFIVDDAIVMLENIVRHVEEGEAPFEAAMRGSREIAFTIVSMTASLVAVFIPVLFMGGDRRTAVQGIRRHHLDDHPDLGPRLADADADAGEPHAARQSRSSRAAFGTLSLVGSRIRCAACRL